MLKNYQVLVQLATTGTHLLFLSREWELHKTVYSRTKGFRARRTQ
ncbi:unnamed protein product [Tenebrio molitor]|nr:unnamed protein product [Tenebrio molitor]